MCSRTDNGETRKKVAPRLRYAIYLRDGLTCCYCGGTVIPGIHHSVSTAAANLEHLTCWSNGGADDARNMMTSCAHCNQSRKATKLTVWAASQGLDITTIRKEIRRRKARKINLKKAAQWLKQIKSEINA